MPDNGSHKLNIADLLKGTGDYCTLIRGDRSRTAAGIEYDSRRIMPGSIFVAIQGFASDGHRFISEVIERGAAGVVIARDRIDEFGDVSVNDVALIAADDTRHALSALSAEFYRRPSERIPVIGVTGTNGKTTTTYMLESIFSAAGFAPGVIGTVNHRWKGRVVESHNTTPESRDLHELIDTMVADGVTVLIMEVSSHSLELHRVDHIAFDAAIFTNLTRDHLDLHKNFENYFAAKRRLFALLAGSPKQRTTAIINRDDDYGKALLAETGHPYRLLSFGVSAEADYAPVAGSVVNTIEGISYSLGERRDIALNLSGSFNIANSLGAIAAAEAFDISFETIQRGLRALDTVPGRFDRISSRSGFSVVVDYAHTDDAVHNILRSVNDIDHGRTITVIGCGGNRDRSKRPLMARAAVEHSDRVIITSDNPRMEDPADIIRDMTEGLALDTVEIIQDREAAIRRAIELALPSDIVVIAGKGHEDYQILGNKKIHFDDREIAAKYIGMREQA